MKTIFNNASTKQFSKTITLADIAAFETGTVHEVYSTFSLARDAEWCGRLFVLDMLEPHEQGIGTSISIHHVSPAFVGETIIFTGHFEEINANKEIVTHFEAYVIERKIAFGVQAQKILPKQKLANIFARIKKA